jgi:acetyl esterase/lipase
MLLVENEVYAKKQGVTLKYDSFLPERAENIPAIVLFHGGGWVSGDKSDMHEIGAYLLDNGFAAFCPQYRLAPLFPYPAPIQDAREFIRFLRLNARHFGISPNAIGAFGNSAGGHLSAMVALTDERTPENPELSSRVDSAVCVAPLTDLTSYRQELPEITWDFIQQFLPAPAEEKPEIWAEASPLSHVDDASPPLLLFHGDADDIVPLAQSEKLYHALKARGRPAFLRTLPGEGHSFSEKAFFTIISETIEFFRETLNAR